jgi:sulfonate transport system ATP-binding protein
MTTVLATNAIHSVHAASVELRNISKTFTLKGKFLTVLTNVDLTIAPGEVVAILGPSGCGKSTLLRLLSGLETASSGEILIDGEKVTHLDNRCSVVFQEPRLLPWRSVVKNVELGLRGKKDPVNSDKAEKLLAEVGLADFVHHFPKQISGGMAQRAALSRALISEPEVLLLDEPFAALDALTRLQMQDLVSSVVAKTGVTVVLVTHDIDEALYLADRIVVLGERGEEIRGSFDINLSHPRDRKDAALAPIRSQLYSLFGIHA